ncbi:MAG TPA: AAA family ATPase, partial [Patescibacteria group bacterium]|nr:AAA family ATPase [Patescibacteria group bacterium]
MSAEPIDIARFDPDLIAEQYGDAIPAGAGLPRALMRSWWDVVDLASAAPPRQIVDGLISADELAMVYAFGGTGKSLFGLELALAVHRGEPFLGRFATAQSRVGIVDEESAPGRLGGRLAQIAHAHAIEPGDACLPLFEVAKGHRVDTELGLEAFWRLIAENELD